MRATIDGLTALLECEPDEYCDRIYAARPEWARDTVSHHDARYLFRRVLASGADRVAEIGTATGVSTVFLCHALAVASRSGAIDDYAVVTYDIDARWYADRSRSTGDAARAMLGPELLDHVTFHAPATAVTVREHHEQDSLSFLFIDADHQHPWPVLDLLATLDCLRPGAEVVLHDINLPTREANHRQWGAKHVFDGLEAEKWVDNGDSPPNIGSVRVPRDKDAFRDQLLVLLFEHPWETDISPEVTTALLA